MGTETGRSLEQQYLTTERGSNKKPVHPAEAGQGGVGKLVKTETVTHTLNMAQRKRERECVKDKSLALLSLVRNRTIPQKRKASEA